MIARNGWKQLKWLEMTGNCWNGWKWPCITGNGWKWLEIAGMAGNGWKQLEMAEWLEMAGNGLLNSLIVKLYKKTPPKSLTLIALPCFQLP